MPHGLASSATGGAPAVAAREPPALKPAPWSLRGSAQERVPWTALVALTCLATLLRAIGLDGGLWLDEIITLVESVRHPLAQIVTGFPGNNQHTLYSVLAHLSIEAFGEQAWSLRLPAVAFGALTPAVLYFFAREFTGRAEALLAALLLAVSYHHVWFSQNARGYSALAFFTLLSSALLLRGLRRGRRADFVWYAIASGFGVYTHLTMVFVVFAHALACAGVLGVHRSAMSRWRAPLTGFALAALIALALYAPLLGDVQQFFLKRTLPPDVATPKWAARAMLSGLQVGAGTLIGVLAGGVLFVCGLWSYVRQSWFLAALFVLPGLITVAAVLVLRQPVFPRFLFFLAGFGVLIVVRGALEAGAWLTRRWNAAVAQSSVTPAGVALAAAMVVASAVSLPFDYRYPKQDFESALRFVQARAGDDPVLTAGGAVYPYREYYRAPWAGLASLEQLRRVRAQGRRVWVLYTLADYIQARTPDLMQALRDDCAVAGVFRGTVAGGDVTVCTLSPLEAVARTPGAG